MGLLYGVASAKVGGPALELTPAAAAAAGVTGLGKPMVLMTFNAEKNGQDEIEDPRVITVAVCAVNPQGNSIGGPVVGIIEWGVGNSAQFSAEFDVPVQSGLSGASLDNLLNGSGILLSVPADFVRVSARNDANLIPRAGGVGGELPIGDAGLVTRATAAMAVGSRGGNAKVPLTRYAVLNSGAAPLAAGASVVLAVPPFARSVQVFRSSANNGVGVSQTGTVALDGPINFAVNAPTTPVPIVAGASTVTLTNNGPGTLTALGAIWEIGL